MMLRSTRFRTCRQTLFVILAAGMVIIAGDRTTAQVAGVGGRQPLVQSQFNNVSGGALAARAPGAYTQQAIAILEGDSSFFSPEPATDEPSFFRETIDGIILDLVDQFTNSIAFLNTLVGGNNLFTTGGGGGGGIDLFNLLTVGGLGSISL